MPEPLRTAPSDAPATDTEREALIERLLLAGLDHYFDGRYEEAVNVWTRVAFLERGHGRARAYIERARGALAERQRQAEEIVHRGVAAYEAGDLHEARQLFTRAIAEGGANETALIFLQRLARLDADPRERGVPAVVPTTSSHPRPGPLRGAGQAGGSDRPLPAAAASGWFSTAAASLLVAGAILLAAQPIASWLGERPISAPVVTPQATDPLPIVRASEVRMARARTLYERGQLYEALRVLATVDLADPLRAQADRMTADVQRDLLAGATDPTSTQPGEAAR